ncbi:MAG: hypothetical protein H8E66_27350 [Planctomycetes bacterium]|nr:hypothetical protein [Planctomycetota bacterium]
MPVKAVLFSQITCSVRGAEPEPVARFIQAGADQSADAGPGRTMSGTCDVLTSGTSFLPKNQLNWRTNMDQHHSVRPMEVRHIREAFPRSKCNIEVLKDSLKVINRFVDQIDLILGSVPRASGIPLAMSRTCELLGDVLMQHGLAAKAFRLK